MVLSNALIITVAKIPTLLTIFSDLIDVIVGDEIMFWGNLTDSPPTVPLTDRRVNLYANGVMIGTDITRAGDAPDEINYGALWWINFTLSEANLNYIGIPSPITYPVVIDVYAEFEGDEFYEGCDPLQSRRTWQPLRIKRRFK